MAINRVGILYHPRSPAAHTLAHEMEQFLSLGGTSVWVCSAWEEEKARQEVKGTELLLTVGGDGTILRAAQVSLADSIPITGINLGRLGFMTELSADEARALLPDLLSGKGWVDERTMLEAELAPKEGGPPLVFQSLNEVAVSRGEVARVLYIEAEVNGKRLTTYKSDGVIVATATGSTGYSLSAGGPILHPQSQAILLVPTLPHLSMAYPLVLPTDSGVTLRVSTMHSAALSIDGHMNLPLWDGAVVNVRRSRRTVRFLRIHPDTSFYGTLEKRLKG